MFIGNTVWFPAVQMALEILQGDMKKMVAKFDALAIKIDGNNNGRVDLLPRFPIESKQSWDEFQNKLGDDSVRLQLVCTYTNKHKFIILILRFCFKDCKLKKIGGKTKKDAVRHAIAHVISPAVSSLFTWHGLRGKAPLKSSPFGKFVVDCFGESELTEHEIGVVIGDWLRHESDKFKKMNF